ncbi:MAG: cyclic pyranopterin monophosphate synthase MoaC [Chloroflexi bacterium]|nr:cyclic pyranopterin monophosphate synthase MoaC [Chloroflexota bacterium]
MSDNVSGQAKMVDVSAKAITVREAVARGWVRMKPETLDALKNGAIPKGDVLAVARVAGIMAAKQVPNIIPLCHPLLLDEVRVDFAVNSLESYVDISASVKCTGRTGTEMEAMTAVAAAALTIYDMCKPLDAGIRLENIRLVRKSGGKSGTVVLD